MLYSVWAYSPGRISVTESTPRATKAALTVLLGAKRPACLWGPPGIGKSDIVREISDELYARDYPEYTLGPRGSVRNSAGESCNRPWLRDIRAVLLDPVDLRGLPTIQDGKAVWATPGELPTSGTGVIFLDELNRAPTLVQNACFQLILDRRLGEYTLPDGWTVIAACNRETDGGGVTRMSSALGNRFVHIDVVADLGDWSTWATQPLDASVVPPVPLIDPVVTAFLRFKPGLLHEFDKDAHAFPTPRSWSFVSDIVRMQPSRDVEMALVEGAVGHGAAVEFLSFVQLWRNLPNIDAIIMDPKGSKVPGDTATLYAVSAALASRATPDNLGRVMVYLDRIPQEYNVFAMRDATVRDPALTTTPEFITWAVKHQDLLG